MDSQYGVNLSNWLSISCQFDLNILQLLGIPGRISVPPLTQILDQNDSIFSFGVGFFHPHNVFTTPPLPSTVRPLQIYEGNFYAAAIKRQKAIIAV